MVLPTTTRTNGKAKLRPVAPKTSPAEVAPPPHDLSAERTVLVACLDNPGAIVDARAIVAPTDFFERDHARLFAAMIDAAELGVPVEVEQLAVLLAETGSPLDARAIEDLVDLRDLNPATVLWQRAAERVRDLSRTRCELSAATGLVAAIRFGDQELIEAARARLAAASPGVCEKPSEPPVTPSSIVSTWRTEGPLQRVPTGIDALDAMCRGGLPVPWRVVIVGAPSAGKTAVGTIAADTLARSAADSGLCVGILAVDEEPEDLTVRLAQIAGFSVAQLELRDPDVLGDVEAALAELRVRFYDATHTIERAAEDLARWCSEEQRRGALLVDSVQAATSDLAVTAKTPREHVESNVRAIRWCVSRHRLLVIATSEANRGSYRSEDAADTTNDMAAGAESRSIEFGAQTLLMLRTPKDQPDVIHVRVAKNRRADRGEFWLRLDRDRHRVTECADPTTDPRAVEQRDEQRRGATLGRLDADAKILVRIIVANPGLGERELRTAVKAAGYPWGRDRLDAAKARLEAGSAGSRLVNRGDDRAHRWHVEPISGDGS